MTSARFFRKSAIALSLSLGFAPVLLAPAGLVAQERGPVQRTLKGFVDVKDGGKVKGAIVYLRDTRTSQVKTAFTDDDGTYRFVQLSDSTDYELWAQSADNKMKSKTKSISSFDSKKDLSFNLTLS